AFDKKISIGMKVLIDGTIPRSAGLSSSSALVVCAALTTAIANGITIGKTDLAERCAECEKYIGTQGGTCFYEIFLWKIC
ncbi:unnamed protein product, partial [Rotaria magnacalcarata]